MAELEFTGERFLPECEREMWYEHWHRYVFALPLAQGKDVLDLACGEGYGSHLLAGAARSVVGVDYEMQAVQHARSRYRKENLRYQQGDATALEFADDGFDLVVSFETIEHLQGQEAMLDEIRRVLRPGGQLLISSPDRKHYADETGYDNPYHVKELYREEFEALLANRFAHRKLWGQRLMFVSSIWPLEATPERGGLAVMNADRKLQDLQVLKPMYELALCSDQPLPETVDMHLFTDEEASVYQHYDDEVRRNMAARKVLQEYEQQLERLRARVEELEAAAQQNTPAATPWWHFWNRNGR